MPKTTAESSLSAIVLAPLRFKWARPAAPSFPMPVKTITVQFSPTAAGTRSANIHIVNTDITENWYDYKLDGNAMVTTGINSIANLNESISLYPNPAKDEATVKIVTENSLTMSAR